MSGIWLTDALEMCLQTIMTDLLLWFTLLSTVINHSGAGIEKHCKYFAIVASRQGRYKLSFDQGFVINSQQ